MYEKNMGSRSHYNTFLITRLGLKRSNSDVIYNILVVVLPYMGIINYILSYLQNKSLTYMY